MEIKANEISFKTPPFLVKTDLQIARNYFLKFEKSLIWVSPTPLHFANFYKFCT